MGYNTGEMVGEHDPEQMPRPYSLLQIAEQEKRLYMPPEDPAKETMKMYSQLERELAQIKAEPDPIDYIPLEKAVEAYCCKN